MWKEYKLGEIVQLNYGKALTASNRRSGDIPVFSSAGITGYHDEPLVESKAVIIGRKGNVGSVYYTNRPFYCIDTAYYVLPDEDRYHLKYLFYLLNNLKLNRLNEDSAVPGLNRETAYSQIVKLPSIYFQNRIAEILSTLDDKIELNRQMNQNLEEMAQAIYKHHFVDGIDPDNLPEGWKKGKVEDCFNVTMGQSPDGKSYNEAGNGMVFFQGRTDFAFRFPEVRMFTTEPKRIANPGDTLISVRAPVGDVNISEVECCIGRGLAAVNHKQGAQSFTYYTLKNMKSEFGKYNGEGTVFGSINKDSFLNITLPIPPEEIIRNFEIKSNDLDSLVLSLSLEIRNLIDIRNYLLPKLISGEILPKDLKQIEEVL